VIRILALCLVCELGYSLGLRFGTVLQCRHHFRKREFAEREKNINYCVRSFEDLKVIFLHQMGMKKIKIGIFLQSKHHLVYEVDIFFPTF